MQSGGTHYPIFGYIATDIAFLKEYIADDTHYEVLMLVVPDTSYNKSVPVLIGTNALKLVQDSIAKNIPANFVSPGGWLSSGLRYKAKQQTS